MATVTSSRLLIAPGRCASLRNSFLSDSRGLALIQPNTAQWQPGSRRVLVTAAAALNKNREYVVVGGGNAAGYVAKALNEGGVADRLCIVSSEKVAPYERPALTKAYLFPLDKSPARLPGFHTCVGGGGERQTAEWYQEKGVEFLSGTTVSGVDLAARTLTTAGGEEIKYGNLIVATGASVLKLPEKIGGNLPGVHYVRDVADADALVESLSQARRVVIVGGGYIGMEISAACATWGLDTTVVFPEEHVMSRLFTPEIAAHYEKLYEAKGINFIKGGLVEKLEAGSSGRVEKVALKDGQTLPADLVIVGIGARPNAQLFVEAGLKGAEGGIEVDGQFRTSEPGVFAIGDVATFPIKILGRRGRVEHVDHARKSAQHVINALVRSRSEPYDYLPYFYSRVFEHPGSDRKVFWQFYGDNSGDCYVVGDFSPKLAAFWVRGGKLRGVFLESGSPEEVALLPTLARKQPIIDSYALESATTVEEALDIAKKAAENEKVPETPHEFKHDPFSG